ncbi:LysE family translocator [Nonomuraea candida]|uniref:LysE family translocator n=1 Tax=Nonomuraea candida TaxID=359159 RepID=UPI0005B91BBB|nr:LysE family translocator [Nonomuraea candida]
MINWVGFVPAALMVSLIPGANQLLGLRNAVRHGALYALAGVLGRLAAFVIFIGLVVAGFGTMLATSSTALTVLKWFGVAYLAWIGIATLRRAAREPVAQAELGRAADRGVWPVVAGEFGVAISNPKAMLLFAALLPQFTGGPAADLDGQLALLGAAYLLVELVVGLGYIGLGSRIGATGLPARTRRRVDLGTGACFLGLAGLLAADDLG